MPNTSEAKDALLTMVIGISGAGPALASAIEQRIDTLIDSVRREYDSYEMGEMEGDNDADR
jgi:hypothetical protein